MEPKWSLGEHIEPFFNAEAANKRQQWDLEARRRDILLRLDRLANRFASRIREASDRSRSDLVASQLPEWMRSEPLPDADPETMWTLLVASGAADRADVYASIPLDNAAAPSPANPRVDSYEDQVKYIFRAKIDRIYETEIFADHTELIEEYMHYFGTWDKAEQERMADKAEQDRIANLREEFKTSVAARLADKGEKVDGTFMQQRAPQANARKSSSTLLGGGARPPDAPVNPSDPRRRNTELPGGPELVSTLGMVPGFLNQSVKKGSYRQG